MKALKKNIRKEKLTRNKLKSVMLVVIVFCLCQMCTPPNNHASTIQLSSEANIVIDKYKSTLKTEKIRISNGIGKDSMMLHILILEPKDIPNRDEKVESMSAVLASEFYDLVVNKNEFEEVFVEIVYDEFNAGDSYRRIENKFKVSELNSKKDD